MPHLARPTSRDLYPFGGSADVGTLKSRAGASNFEPGTYGFRLRTCDCELSTWKFERRTRISELATCKCEVGHRKCEAGSCSFELGTCSSQLGTCDCKVVSCSSGLQDRATFLQNSRKHRQRFEIAAWPRHMAVRLRLTDRTSIENCPEAGPQDESVSTTRVSGWDQESMRKGVVDPSAHADGTDLMAREALVA